MTKQRKTWEQFKRRTPRTEFWACINADGVWFDTGWDYSTALHWCRMDSDEYGPVKMSDVEWFNQHASQLGYTVVNHVMLQKLYNKGLVK